MRGKGVDMFERVFNNIEHIARYKRPDMVLGISYVLIKYNYNIHLGQ